MGTVERIKTIFSQMEESVDAIIIKNASAPFIDSTFFYVTGIRNGLFEGCCIVLYPDGSSQLLVSTLEAPLVPHSQQSITFSSRDEYQEHLKHLTEQSNNIGINTSSILYQEYLGLQQILPDKQFISVSNAIIKSRTIKDSDELERIRKACAIADQVMSKIPSFFTEPLTEQQLAAEIEYHLKKYGASGPAFETISSSGPNTAKPHYTSGNDIIKPGNFIICDFGASLDHYHSDITRTFIYGQPSDQQKNIHQTVLQAQKKALEAIKPGVAARVIHQIAFDTIEKSPFKGHFIHSTGHGLGLEVHDPGIGFADHYESILQPGMVLTVEPGIYIPGLGGVRIEDDIVITSEGYLQLTTSPKDLIEIPLS